MDLADELLHEVFDQSDVDDVDEKIQKPLEGAFSFSNGEMTLKTHEDRNSSGITKNSRKTEKNGTEKTQLSSTKKLFNVHTLLKSEFMINILNKIDAYSKNQTLSFQGNIEDHPEYQLIVDSNNLAVEIDNEIITINKFIRDNYSQRFPELESLVVNPLDYAKTVRIIGNQMDITQVNLSHLPSATVMVITVTNSTSEGTLLQQNKLDMVFEACDLTLELESAKKKILEYVQSRMNLIAPNLLAIVGSTTAAKLISVAGGLAGLVRMPGCNISALGAKRQSQTGFSSTIGIRHQGFLFHSEILQKVPPDLRKQALRIISSKIALASRVDRLHQSPDGSIGASLREYIEKRLDKLSQPNPSKTVKALPAPNDAIKKRRGGRRMRAMKERYQMTELRKQQNRLAFGKQELEVSINDEMEGMGMIGQDGQYRIRAPIIDSRSKAKVGKAIKHFASFSHNSGTATSGLASSVVFGSNVGMQLINPELLSAPKTTESNDWFKGGTFTQVHKP
ncbi:hypothetical protein PNEG_02115 [Pneumocystis murina B123]|uniref:Nop domain-containing protein n=1 Tax=Pneumocystis murina (strain B123) TaxID=1069680 RepID=M7P6L9_PNEMU|nr:hypothetical protein PNEG_02115 [Pneumocystis murina B123]EMR09530.1 hypothetical protein PNEG_02115 [Pneumocystis murina B123]